MAKTKKPENPARNGSKKKKATSQAIATTPNTAEAHSNARHAAPVLNYNELLITKVLSGEGKKTDPILAEFLYSIYSLSPAMGELSYRYGISIGRLLYRMGTKKQRHKILYRNEHMGDLLHFLEAAGLGKATFHPTTHGTIIRMYRERKLNSGHKTHFFEAGLIAGFLGAAGTSIPYVKELVCTSEGGEFCEYVCLPLSTRIPEEHTVSPQALREIGYGIASVQALPPADSAVPAAYQAILAEIGADKAYTDNINTLVSYAGSFCRAGLGLRGKEKLWDGIAATISLLNFGEPSIARKGRKLTITSTLDVILSRREFARMTASFIVALASGAKSTVREAKITSTRGRYRINLEITA